MREQPKQVLERGHRRFVDRDRKDGEIVRN